MGAPTADEVKTYREEHGVGMQDAKRILDARWREERLRMATIDAINAETVQEIRSALLVVIGVTKEII